MQRLVAGGAQGVTEPVNSDCTHPPGRDTKRVPPVHRAKRGQETQASPDPKAQAKEAGSDALEQAPVAGSVNNAACAHCAV